MGHKPGTIRAMAENSSAAPRNRGPGRPFAKGESGNPGGRPKKLREVEAAIEAATEPAKVVAVVEKLQELALGGDVHAARVYLDRVLGPVRPERHDVDLSDAPAVVLEWMAANLRS
jgi:hypothetical protein